MCSPIQTGYVYEICTHIHAHAQLSAHTAADARNELRLACSSLGVLLVSAADTCDTAGGLPPSAMATAASRYARWKRNMSTNCTQGSGKHGQFDLSESQGKRVTGKRAHAHAHTAHLHAPRRRFAALRGGRYGACRHCCCQCVRGMRARRRLRRVSAIRTPRAGAFSSAACN